jgi:hypothetical protein
LHGRGPDEEVGEKICWLFDYTMDRDFDYTVDRDNMEGDQTILTPSIVVKDSYPKLVLDDNNSYK